MQDRAVVAAVVAGDAEGFGAAYDKYGASLYARCRSVLPEDEAAGAVLDTFLVAAAKLDGLRDPDRLGSWLLAVARNECRRRMDPGRAAEAGTLEAAGALEAAGTLEAAGSLEAAGVAEPDGGLPAELPPPGLRGRVMAACMDNSPAGRAHRVSVAHRAGMFGPTGFPKAAGPSGPRWWRGVRRRPGVAAAAAAGVALALAAGITVMLTAGGSGARPHAAGTGLAAAGSGPASIPASGPAPGPASGSAPGRTRPAPSPARTAPGSAQPTPLVTVPLAAASPATPAPPATSLSPSQTPSSSPSPSPSTTPAQGALQVKPRSLHLTSASGKPASGSFTITAVGGPVRQFTVLVAAVAAEVKAAPASGSLPAGGSVQVTVTVTSKAGLTTHVIVGPGSISVMVVYKVKT